MQRTIPDPDGALVTIEGAAPRVRTAPSVTTETITDDELYALRDEAIAAGDDGTRNIACGALNAVDQLQGFACRQACAAVLNARRFGPAMRGQRGALTSRPMHP